MGQNRIQIHLNQMDRSELLRNQALLDIFSLIIRSLQPGQKKRKVEITKFYKADLMIDFIVEFLGRKIPNFNLTFSAPCGFLNN